MCQCCLKPNAIGCCLCKPGGLTKIHAIVYFSRQCYSILFKTMLNGLFWCTGSWFLVALLHSLMPSVMEWKRLV